MEYSAEFLGSLGQFDAGDWNRVCGGDYPFLRHEFLWGLEKTACTTAETGWQPCHLVIRRDDELIALMPLYLKSHSYGEYVFDWSWADAWRRSGLEYYPKLVTAIPFTPATGPRLCVRAGTDSSAVWPVALQAIQQFAERQAISSWHMLFPQEADSILRLETATSSARGVSVTTRAMEFAIEPVPTNPQRTAPVDAASSVSGPPSAEIAAALPDALSSRRRSGSIFRLRSVLLFLSAIVVAPVTFEKSPTFARISPFRRFYL